MDFETVFAIVWAIVVASACLIWCLFWAIKIMTLKDDDKKKEKTKTWGYINGKYQKINKEREL